MACCACIFLFICAAAIALKIYWKLATKWNRSYTCLVGKTAIVTGANTGIGYITALDLAMRGAKVILACRNKDRAVEAQRKITKATGNENVLYKLVDMASLKSVRDFTEDFNKTEDRLDILVNNAGLGYLDQEYTDDGIQTILHVNHIAPFLLTHLLIEKLKKSGRSRIVNVASMAAKRAKLTIQNFESINEVPPVTNSVVARDNALYSNSKLCNVLFTLELAKKLDGTEVTTNTLHPGVIATEFFRKFTGILKILMEFLAATLLLTPEEGAQTQIYLSVSKEVDGVSGGLFANCTQTELYETAKDPQLARKLWQKSEEMAKLSESEKMK